MKTKGFVLTLLTACFFGLGAVLGKMVTGVLNPLLVTFLDFSIGGLLLGLFLAWRRISLFAKFTRHDWLDLLLLSIFGTALPACSVIFGLGLTSAIKAGFLLQIQSIAAVLFVVIFLHEKLTLKQLGGMLLLILGSVFVVMKSLQARPWEAFNLGDILIILGALGFGYAYLPGKKLSSKIDSLPLNIWKLLIGSIMIFPVLLLQKGTFNGHFVPMLLWAMPLYIITNFCIGYVTLQAGIRYLQAWESATIMQTTPIFSTIFAILMLGDTLSPLQIIGGAIVLLGGFIVVIGGARKVIAANNDLLVEQDAKANVARRQHM
ncbi:MAG TPA: DMT family transporter [Ktedonobacteraceae bacterium]|nr:DMT family transporter [Ktedonobacteraceae bacterium]